MSRLGKTFLFVSAIALIVLMSMRYLLEGWTNIMSIPLGVLVVCFALAVIIDFRLYKDFFTMRTTKHGMNMGVMILLGLILLVAVNYLGVRFNKTADFTEERLNSLSLQTLDILKKLKGDVNVVVFYKGEDAREQRNQVKQAFELYQEANPQLKVRYYNSYVENLKAQEYLGALPDKQQAQVFVFAEYQGKKIRIDAPFSEEQITQGFIKATHPSRKIYFLQGHGERDLESSDVEGLSDFKKDLLADAMTVEKLSLMEKGVIPEDADVVAIVGTTSQLFPQELEVLHKYAEGGGRLFIAVDPGQKHNLANLTKNLGVEYMNNYIVSASINNKLLGKGAVTAMGLKFDATSDITKRFQTGRNYTSFDLASEVKPATAGHPELKAAEFLQTDPSSFTMLELKQPKSDVALRTVTLGVDVKGKLKTDSKDESKKEFEMVVFGDSDFLTNHSIGEGLNKDMALNSIAVLANQGDLVSIRAPVPKGTKVVLTRVTVFAIFIGCILLPLFLLITSATLWFRRRNA